MLSNATPSIADSHEVELSAEIMRTRNKAKLMDANNVQTEEEDQNRTMVSQFQGGSALLKLAPEIVMRILIAVGQDDVGSLAKVAPVCRLLAWYIYQDPDKALWRELHNHYFDDPRQGFHFDAGNVGQYEWRSAVTERWVIMKLLEDDTFEEVLEDRMPALKAMLPRVSAALLKMYHELGSPTDKPVSLNGPLLDALIGSRTFERLYHATFEPSRQPRRNIGHAILDSRHQDDLRLPNPDLAHLHVLRPWFSAAAEQANFQSSPDARPAHLRNLAAFKTITYNIRNYSAENDFGPFNNDGTVNWPVVDALAQTMDANVTYVTGNSPFRGKPSSRFAYRDWTFAKPPFDGGLDFLRGLGLKDIAQGDKNWAKVNGTWRGSYAFMDYTDWMEFNFNSTPLLRRRADPIQMDSYIEAVGDYMSMQLTTELTDLTKSLPELPFNTPISDKVPPLIFNGTSSNRSGPGGSGGGAHVRGRVALTPDDPPQVRWTWVVRFDNEDRWRIEAVQIGGRGSKRGLVGVWSDVERGELSPVGPLCYWPILADEAAEEEARHRAMAAQATTAGAGIWDDNGTDGDFESDSEMLSEESDGELVSEGDAEVFFA